MYKVFLSSTTADLGAARRAVAEALPPDWQAIHMERFVADARQEAQRDAGEVRDADVAVFLLGWRYGSRPAEGGPSYTHLELRAAVKARIPCLVFLQSETEERRAASDALNDMLELRAEAGRAAAPGWWEDPSELPVRVADALRRHRDRPLTREWLWERLQEGCRRLSGAGPREAWPELEDLRAALLGSGSTAKTRVLLEGPSGGAGAAMAALAHELHRAGGVALLVPGSALDAHQPWSSWTQRLSLPGWTPERTRPALRAAGDGRVLVMIPGLEGSRDPDVWRTSLLELEGQLGDVWLVVSVQVGWARRVVPPSRIPPGVPQEHEAGTAEAVPPAPLPRLPWRWPQDVRAWLALRTEEVEKEEREAASPWRPDERVQPTQAHDDPVYVPLGGEERESPVRRVEYRRSSGPITPAAVILQGGDRMYGGVELPGGWVAGRTEVPDVCRELLRRHEPMVLLGEPGSGKTTTLRQLFLRLARRARWWPGAPVPVFVRLASFRQEVQGKGAREVIGLIRDAIGPGVPSLTQHLQGGQVTTSLVVFFDGMDEIPRGVGHRERVEALAHFAAEYAAQVRCVFACRTNDFDPSFRHAQLVLKPFDEPRMREYLRRRLGERFRVDGQEQELRQATRRLLAPDQLGEAARNPFTLALACDLLQTGRWPRGVVGLLMGHVERLAARARMRAGVEAPTGEEVAASVHEWAALAWAMFRRDGAVVVERGEAEGEVGAGPVQSAIEGGLLIRESSRLRFQHHRLQEVLVAWFLCQPGAPQPEWGRVLGSPRWQETLLGYVALGGRGEEALEVVIGGLREAAGRFRELHPQVERAEEAVRAADKVVASIGPDVERWDPQGGSHREYSPAQLELRVRAEARANAAREELRRLRSLPRDEEFAWSEAALFAARVFARLGGQPALQAELTAVVDGLMRYGRPPAQVRTLWAWHEAVRGLATDLITPARRSKVAWVRSQVLMALAATPAQHLGEQEFAEEVEAQLWDQRLLPIAADLLDAVSDQPERWRLVRTARRIARVVVGLEVGIWSGTGAAVVGSAGSALSWERAAAAYLVGTAACGVLLARSHTLSVTRRLVIGAAVTGGALLTWLVPVVGEGGEITPASLEVLPEALVGGAPAWAAWVTLVATEAVGRWGLRGGPLRNGLAGPRSDAWDAQLSTLFLLGIVGSGASLLRWQPMWVFGALVVGLGVGMLAVVGMVLWLLADLSAGPWKDRWREAEGQRWPWRLVSTMLLGSWDNLRWVFGGMVSAVPWFLGLGFMTVLVAGLAQLVEMAWRFVPAWAIDGASAVGAGVFGLMALFALLGSVGVALYIALVACSYVAGWATWLARNLHITWSHLLHLLRPRSLPHPTSWESWSRTFLRAAPPDRLDLLSTLDPTSLHLSPSDLLSRLPDLEDRLGDHPDVISAWHATMYRLQESARQQRWAPPPGDEPPAQGME